jgi:hypothetical protein
LETNELNSLESAEKDLRFYAAIIGHHPTMDPNAPPPLEAEQDAPPDPLLLHPLVELDPLPPRPHKPHALRLWIRQMSSSARKRIDEAYHRLAS